VILASFTNLHTFILAYLLVRTWHNALSVYVPMQLST